MASETNLETDQESYLEPIFDLNNVTLPGHLDQSSPFTFDQRQVPNILFSPTSPGGIRSPNRPRTMKEYEDELGSLKKENYNLKLRIYFTEQNRMDLNLPKDVEELQKSLTKLTVEFESKKKELSDHEDLLMKSYKVLDTQRNQLEAIKAEHETEKQTLQNKIDSLEKELKEYHTKFMETSVHLDDTTSLYALTFGLNNKHGMEKVDELNEKIKYLESDLEKEKERVMILEGENTQLKSNLVKEQDELKNVQDFVNDINKDLEKSIKERDHLNKFRNEATCKLATLEKNMEKTTESLKQKENQIEQLKSLLKAQERKLVEASQQEDKPSLDHQRKIKLLTIENKHLKEQIKEIQKQLEKSLKNGCRSSRDPPAVPGWSDQEWELHRKLKESELKREELQKEIIHLKSVQDNGQTLIQTLIRENKTLKRSVDGAKTNSRSHSGTQMNSSKEEVRIDELVEKMPTEKDDLVSELYSKIEELTKALKEKEYIIEQLNKFEPVTQSAQSIHSKNCSDLKSSEDHSVKYEKQLEELTNELEQKGKEVDNLKRELKKKTFNLQGLVNTELWDKNREIEKLNKVCERKHLEVLGLRQQMMDYQKSVVQDKVNSFVSSYSSQSNLFTEDKENLQPVPDPTLQIRQLNEENRLLTRKVEELQERLLNTPERDTESLLVQTLRSERDQAEKLRKEAFNACLLLTTRLQELADFLDSLLPTLCGKKRKVVQQAVERSRELSRSLSLAADDSSVMHCSAWSDLQPSLYVPLLPDISTVDFWSGEEDEDSSEEELARLKSQVETLTEEMKLKDSELSRFQSEKQTSDSSIFKSIFGYHNQNFIDSVENNLFLNNIPVSIAEITEPSLVDAFSEQNMSEKTPSTKQLPQVKSANIGTITVSSRKKEQNSSYNLITFEDQNKTNENATCMSECDSWSEPDRDVSFARMGLKEKSTNVSKALQCKLEETSETADFVPKSSSPKRISEVHRLQRKIHSLEEVNEALRKELLILHQLTPSVSSRQDKATSIEFSRQSLSSIPSHLLEEIRIQREKLEASLFHNDYIRRQLENTVLSLRKSQDNGQENLSQVKLRDVTNQLEQAERELTSLKSEKERWNREMEQLQCSLQQQASELSIKQCALLELEKNTNEKLKEVEEKYNKQCSQIEAKCEQLGKKWLELQREKEDLLGQIEDKDKQVTKLSAEITNYEYEGKKNKQVVEDLNNKIQQISQKKEDLQRVVSEQEQLLADAERERQELATQLIARDRQVGELQKQLSNVEQASNELESALRSQLDLATHQCAQFEAKLREQDSICKRREEEMVGELQRRLDAARFAHSEAVLQYTRVANDNIRLQQQLRTRHHEPNNQMAQIEKTNLELEHKVAELKAVNIELENRLGSRRPSYSDYETDVSPWRKCPPHLTLPGSPHRAQHNQDLTSDYLSDQDAILSPQSQTSNLWTPSLPLTHASTSPDLGIESDHGRFSSLEQAPASSALLLKSTPVKDLIKLEEENTQLRCNLQKTRHALEETLAQLTAANHHKRQYEAQLSAATQKDVKVERAICHQLKKTHCILKKVRSNLESGGKEEKR